MSNPNLSNSDSDLMSRINRFIEEERGFLERGLSLKELSDHLSVTASQVSRTIHARTGMRFSEFINRYRVEEAKRMLLNCPDFKVIDIAFRSGFNNKVTFNTAFRKFTGCRPLEYRKKQGSMNS